MSAFPDPITFFQKLLETGEWNRSDAEILLRWWQKKLSKSITWPIKICKTCERPMRDDVVGLGYMVNNNLWASAGFQPTDTVHVKCLQKVLGRDLVGDDFAPSGSCNLMIRYMLANGLGLP